MRKALLPLAGLIAIAAIVFFTTRPQIEEQVTYTRLEPIIGKYEEHEEGEKSHTSGMDKITQQEIERTKDLSTGEVPIERLMVAREIQQAK
ncbi:MAG TPA: hypothetical protein VFZ47_06405, partial [Chitinophagaceae bacterium]